MIVGALTAALTLGGAQAYAADLEIVIDRHEDAIELFVATPASNFGPIFGATPAGLANSDGLVEIDPLRQGTWAIGDALFRDTNATTGDEPVVFEAMSFMVHPVEDRVPMTDPLEAVLAVSVCTVDLPGQVFALDRLFGYAGFIAYTGRAGDALSVDFAETGRGTLDVSVRTFDRGRPTGSFTAGIADGGTLVIPAYQGAPFPIWAALLALCGLGASAGGVALHRIRLRRTLRPA
ncbi:MAG: hypothetical protein AAGB15_04265 [Pseudomonadota bacterium]